MNVNCFMVEPTGRHTAFIDGVSHSIWRRIDNGQEYYGPDAVGAMWYAPPDAQSGYRPGPDGRTLFVQTPGGTWDIDGRANNCGLPSDNIHFCWVRHGTPPMITVNKQGRTCKAGGGSIALGKYHGHLTKGQLTNC